MQKFGRNILEPLAIFVLFTGIYVGISEIKGNSNLYLPVWDVEHYLSISESGYIVYPCTPGVEYPSGKICGNVGWYPFWPIVVRIFRPLFGGAVQWSFIGLAFVFTLLSFILLHSWLRQLYDRNQATLVIAALAFNPAGFYLLTGFPYALFILLLISYLIIFYDTSIRLRNLYLFLLGLGISLTYPTGILVAAVPFAAEILDAVKKKDAWKKTANWRRVFLYLCPFILGPLLLWSYFYFRFDDFFLQLHFQEKYQRVWGIPFAVIFQSLARYPWTSPDNLTLLWYGLALIIFIPYRTKPELWIFALVLYLFSPATGTTMSIYRHYIVIMPVYIIIGVSSRPIWFKGIYILAGLAISLLVLFPQFILNRLI